MKKLMTSAAVLTMCLTLTSCYTVRGIGEDVEDASHWAKNKPSTMGKFIGYAPRGYAAKTATQIADEDEQAAYAEADANTPETPENQPTLATADTTTTVSSSGIQLRAPSAQGAVRRTGGLSWNKIDNYNAQNPSLSGEGADDDIITDEDQIAQARHRHNPGGSVKYGDSVNVFPVDGDLVPYTQLKHVSGNYTGGGEKASEVFFAHGSSKVSKMDRKNLHELAGSLRQNGDYRVDVVGHASKRVNGAVTKMEKKMINFRVAQKRADAVASEMMSAGLKPGMVVATSAGDEDPNPHRGNKSQEAADRRADVYVSNQ